jgi:predicted DNA-binding transcriptional regulator YafY
LFLTGIPTAAADLGLGATVTAAQLKLMAALPPELRDRAGRIAQRFHLDAPSWYRDSDDTPHLNTVAAAVWSQQALRMHYMRWAEPHEITRVVQPYGLVLKAGHWYVVARGEEMRTYRVSRILDAQILPDTFERTPDFDLATFWHEYLTSFDARRFSGEATIRMRKEGQAGWAEVKMPIESAEQALPELLKLGADAEILAPPELRAKAIEVLRAMTRLYEP